MTGQAARSDQPRVALVSHSTKARGGVAHTLSLAEAMVDDNMPVRIVSLGDPEQGFYRPVRAPYSLVSAPAPADTLEERAAARVRDAGANVRVLRTVHHVDDFTTAALIDCQRRAIEEPDQLIVVSEDWRIRLKADYDVDAVVIHNGTDATRFPPIEPSRRAALRRRFGLSDRFVSCRSAASNPVRAARSTSARWPSWRESSTPRRRS